MKHSDEEIAKSKEIRERLRGSIIYDDPFAPCWPKSPEEMRLDCNAIVDWDSFHRRWAEAAGFPSFYGRNMNAWIDCMSDMRAKTNMSRFFLESGQVLVVYLRGAASLRTRLPEIFNALLDATIAVNLRYQETGHGAALALILV